MNFCYISTSEEKSKNLGYKISEFLFPGSVITLSGDLGAGKTTLAGGIARGLGIKDRVNSPTFNIMKCYFNATIPLFHIDAYRLEDGNKEIGLEEFIEGKGITLIEWPVYIKELINFDTALKIEITHLGNDQRKIIIQSSNTQYHKLFDALKELCL